MRAAAEEQAILLQSLETRRREILRELASVTRQIADTAKQRDHLEERLQAHTQSNAA